MNKEPIKRIPRARRKNTINYLNNEEFYNALVEWRKTPDAPITDYIGKSILLICRRLATSGNFVSYSYNDEMVSDALENCLTYIRNFDPEKSKNPFAYFTTIAYYAFLRRIDKEKKQQYIKLKSTEIFHQENIMDASVIGPEHAMHDNNYEFIEKFERKKAQKKEEKPVGLEVFLEKKE